MSRGRCEPVESQLLRESELPQAVADTADSAATVVGPFGEITSTLFDVLAANIPRDLKWPTLILTVVIATSIWLIRRRHGAKGADGREHKLGLLRRSLLHEYFSQ